MRLKPSANESSVRKNNIRLLLLGVNPTRNLLADPCDSLTDALVYDRTTIVTLLYRAFVEPLPPQS